jgi:hypothetical protein
MKTSGTFRECKVVGRCLRTPKCHAPARGATATWAPSTAGAHSIPLLKVEITGGQAVHDSKIKFPLPHRVLGASTSAKRANTFF